MSSFEGELVEEDRAALVKLKPRRGVEIWGLPSGSLGRWDGVVVNAEGRVVHLALDRVIVPGKSPALGGLWRIIARLLTMSEAMVGTEGGYRRD